MTTTEQLRQEFLSDLKSLTELLTEDVSGILDLYNDSKFYSVRKQEVVDQLTSALSPLSVIYSESVLKEILKQ